jgi:hypothetical protein
MTNSTTLTWPSLSIDEVLVPAFKTKYTAPVQRSLATTIDAVYFDKANREIIALCSDTATRKCKIDRLADRASQVMLWKSISNAVAKKQNVVFLSAGGFSANKWFFDFEILDRLPEIDSDLPF